MKIVRHNIVTCCGGTQIVAISDAPLTVSFIEFLVKNQFKEHSNFTSAGIIYVQNEFLTISGPIGSNKINIKCRKENCADHINNLETLLLNFTS